MTKDDFNKQLDGIIEIVKSTLMVKQGDYVPADNRMSQFIRAGEALRCTPARALVGMMQKHDTTLLDYVDMLEQGKLMTIQRWREVLIDGINYRIMLLAMIEELNASLRAQQEAMEKPAAPAEDEVDGGPEGEEFMGDESVEEGGVCPLCHTGRLELEPVENCTCHIAPPCSACMDRMLICPDCGWSQREEVGK